MKDNLAERLLAETMKWGPREVASERPYLQAMASYKYDEYQQFAPGIRFVESLALWLQQFPETQQRCIAYKFVKSRLIFCSDAEMAHLVRSVFPDFVRPLLMSATAATLDVPKWRVSRIAGSPEYKVLLRQCLFLGLSDGSHIDIFRRATTELSHEQIYQSYEVTRNRAESLRRELEKSLVELLGRKPASSDLRFRFIFLLDDFSGSGTSYLRKDGDSFTGKLRNIYNSLGDEREGLGSLVDVTDLTVCLILYMATQQAIRSITSNIQKFLAGPINWRVEVVQELGGGVPLQHPNDREFIKLCQEFYDPRVETEHIKRGGLGARLGFADCAVPLIHSHNAPNNAPFLLWSNPQDYSVRGLFPRIERHR